VYEAKKQSSIRVDACQWLLFGFGFSELKVWVHDIFEVGGVPSRMSINSGVVSLFYFLSCSMNQSTVFLVASFMFNNGLYPKSFFAFEMS